MLRGGGGILASLPYQLFIKCWKSYRIPNYMCKAVIVPLYKGKVSRQIGTNYRPINLLSVVGKLYTNIIIDGVLNETENKIWDVQARFQKGMGCTD
ncbi:hypothetical protein EVAR_100263_1 [Eumeta japonica]|uniref:Uncharacterized protein n=1 Tax=Eumeta variegata TaxID=151549 RepID=A0A4C1ZXV6_EUMVA|nr:hypothetical protein EVAR_100263_1 [Eumeta japonica]